MKKNNSKKIKIAEKPKGSGNLISWEVGLLRHELANNRIKEPYVRELDEQFKMLSDWALYQFIRAYKEYVLNSNCIGYPIKE